MQTNAFLVGLRTSCSWTMVLHGKQHVSSRGVEEVFGNIHRCMTDVLH